MPNAPKTKKGTSLKERLSAAAKATSEQQRERSSRPVRTRGDSSDSTSKRQPAASKRKTTTKRRATGELSGKGSKAAEKKPKQKRTFREFVNAHVKATIAVVLAVLIVAILYPAGRIYYQSLRHEQHLQAQLTAEQEDTEAIKSLNGGGDSDEAQEQALRREGFVKQGEEAAVVTNIDAGAESALPQKPNLEEIHAPQTWYYTILDKVFFVSE